MLELDQRKRKLFISRAGPDAEIAAEIGRALEEAGFEIILQQRDFGNRNFIERMHEALKSSDRVIALISPAYLISKHCTSEWTNVIADDPTNDERRLIILRIADCRPDGMLRSFAYTDLFPLLENRNLLAKAVVAAVRDEHSWHSHVLIQGTRGPQDTQERQPPSISDDANAEKKPEAFEPQYYLPTLSLLNASEKQSVDVPENSRLLEETLASLGLGATITNVERGPTITRYELKLWRGVRMASVSARSEEIGLALATKSPRIEAPIPGRSLMAIELPSVKPSTVSIADILGIIPKLEGLPPLNVAIGKGVTGRSVLGQLESMPNLLIGGAAGTGKSTWLNAMIVSLLFSVFPNQVQFLLIDISGLELTAYDGVPHLISNVITDARLAACALKEITRELDSRHKRLVDAGVRKIEDYNTICPEESLPFIVIVIDELTDLMLFASNAESLLCRLAKSGRAVGIHTVIATRDSSNSALAREIKSHFPSRIAFAVPSKADSRAIIGTGGAEQLVGGGDMLYFPLSASKPIRCQGALPRAPEIARLAEFWTKQPRPSNLISVQLAPVVDSEVTWGFDSLCFPAAVFIIESDYASTAQLQSRFSIGHPRAVRVMKQLEEAGVVGPHEGPKPRRIYIDLAELELLSDRLGRWSESTELFEQGI